ncbi:MAG: hypothetical protein R2830_11345 [Saprospiraceae bacterium]
MKWSPTLFLLMVLFFVAGCKKSEDLQDAEIISGSAEFAIPLFKASTSIEELLENFDEYTVIEVDADGVVHLRYVGDVLTQQAAEFFAETKAKLPFLIPLDSTYFALPFKQEGQLEVDFATYGEGIVYPAVICKYPDSVFLTMKILQAVKGNDTLTMHSKFLGPLGDPFPYFFDYDSVQTPGYNLIPNDGVIYVSYDARNKNGEPVDMDFVGLCSRNIDFSYIEGYLGNFTNRGKRDSISIDFFKNWVQGDVYFQNPVIKIHIINSFGLPTRSSIDTFDILTADGQRKKLESSFISDTGIDFAYPDLNSIGETRSMTFVFNADNSNIEDVLSSRPIALDYKVDAIMNPDSIAGLRGFITDSSYYKIQVEVDLPLYGRASGFVVTDTFNVDLSQFDEAEEVEFKMVADNGMPLGIDAQVYFIGENGVALDTLFENTKQVVASAPVDAQGIVTERISQITFTTFDSIRFDKVRPAKKLALVASFSTFDTGQQPVKALKGQGVEIRMGMKVKRK